MPNRLVRVGARNADMLLPLRAPVRPRVRSVPDGEALPLDDEVLRLVETAPCGVIAILGPAGSGKTTALHHLAAVLPPDTPVALLDEPTVQQALLAAFPSGFLVYTASSPRPVHHLAQYRLEPWADDDLIEYLLARHQCRCGSVMARVGRSDRTVLGGLPDLWQVVLEQLAADEALPDVRAALHRYLEAQLSDTDLVERARSVCLNALVAGATSLPEGLNQLARPGFVAGLLRALRHRAVRLLLAAERIAADLRGDANCDFLATRLPRDLVETAAAEVRGDDRAVGHLCRLLAGPTWSHPMAASILHALDRRLLPTVTSTRALAGAYLAEAVWPGADLRQVNLAGADLRGADLRRVNLDRADLGTACLADARLAGARLPNAWLQKAELARADLTEVLAHGAHFETADLRGACLDEGRFDAGWFEGADLSGASFRGARLSSASFLGTQIEGADFSAADLSDANLAGLRLREATFTGADFTRAQLPGCDLEGMDLPAACFEQALLKGALLTGSRMPSANFRNAQLVEAGLAEIDWEGADLGGADLRGASFHLGSTRSGLVNSPIACEGSKTGFYTDDYEEQSYKAPEEIRKANLCGADLRGAHLADVDFYLVDLRGARYDPEHADHLRRSGAILEARV